MRFAQLMPITYLLSIMIGFSVVFAAEENAPIDFKSLEKRGDRFYLPNAVTPFSGKVRSFHENGKDKKFKEGMIINGKWEGSLVEWRKNGKKMSKGGYKNGKKEGVWTWWHDNGQKKVESTFKNGKLIKYRFWDKEGNESVN